MKPAPSQDDYDEPLMGAHRGRRLFSMIVVIPTNRSVHLEYLTPLIESGARFIVVDDSEGSVTVDHPQFQVYSWADRRRMLGPLEIAIPKRNGACRDFGFYIAWKESDDDEIIVALDDDCRVYHSDFAERVERSLSNCVRPVATPKDVHLNSFDLYDGMPGNLFPRGYPYTARVNFQPCTFEELGVEGRPAKFSLGLWQGVFDINAIDKLHGSAYVHEQVRLHHESVFLGAGCLVSVCSGNMQFRRGVLPAVYQLPMNIEVLPGWVIDRYGDIWAGHILKTLMDLRGDIMAMGEPMVQHLIEGNYTRNIIKEHVCHLVNDEFLRILALARENIRPASYVEMMKALNEEFRRATPTCSSLLKPYFEHLTGSVEAWLSALTE